MRADGTIGKPENNEFRPHSWVVRAKSSWTESVTLMNEPQMLLTVKQTAQRLGRTEKAIRRLYEKRILTPIRIDGRVQIEAHEIECLIEKAKREARNC